MTRWLILVHRIPPRPIYLRAKIRQRLDAAGAVAVKNAVYLLPENADSLEDFQWIAQEIVAGGGDAHLFRGGFVDGDAGEAAVAQFRAARQEDYQSVIAAAHVAHPDAAALARRLEEIGRIDFFSAPDRAAAEKAVVAAGKRQRGGRKEKGIMQSTKARPRGRTWVTRPGVKIDRMASAWLIRRFIDPKARFRFRDAAAPRGKDELRFDMTGGDFTHEGDRCTFETLVRRFGLPDKGVRAIAEIVHDLDLKDEKYRRPESGGVRAMIEGLIGRTADDQERIDRAAALFDDLHRALGPKRAT